MEAKEKWNLIVKQYKENYNKLESKVQKLWEGYCIEFLNYSFVSEEIDTQRTIHIGVGVKTIPDIILKKNNEDIFDIELKKYNLFFDNAMEEQLKSYLDLLHISCAMIVCNKIYLYYYDYNKKQSGKYAIPFEENNEDGIRLIELLQKENFDEEKIKEFIIDKLIHQPIKPAETETISPPSSNIGLDFPRDPMFMIIKTSDERVNSCKGNLYDATRHCWRVRYEKVIHYPYVLAVIKGYVKEVYKVKKWDVPERWENDGGDVSNRLEFIGEVAPEGVRNKWLNKEIPEKFRKKGLASPTLYSDMKD